MNPLNPTIMLVNGRPAGLAALSAVLADVDCKLEATADGLSAWQMLAADPGRYGVVILDHRCPGPERMQLLDKMQGHPLLRGVPVILQTDSIEQTAARGAPGVFCIPVKAFDHPSLIDALRTAMGKRISFRAREDCACPERQSREQCEATFTFKTPDSARELAARLASTCPEPQRVVVGLAELLLNAVEHGNLSISFAEKTRLRRENRWEEEIRARLADPTHADKEVWVEYVRERDRIRVLIRDQGDGFDWREYLGRDPAEAMGLHGRGIAIARMMSFDSIEYRGRGNEVEVTIDTRPR